MRKPLPPLLLAGACLLGGCQYAGFAPLIVEAVNDANRPPRYTGEELGPAAAEACRGRAVRHGRVAIGTVEPHGNDMMRVYGTIEEPSGAPGRSFACVFRGDGSIPHFRLSERAEPKR